MDINLVNQLNEADLLNGGRKYKPAEVARILITKYGYRVTPAVIRKWDNVLLQPNTALANPDRLSGENRSYTEKDIQYFSLVALLRTMGYDLEEVSSMLAGKDLGQVVSELRKQLARQTQAIADIESSLNGR